MRNFRDQGGGLNDCGQISPAPVPELAAGGCDLEALSARLPELPHLPHLPEAGTGASSKFALSWP